MRIITKLDEKPMNTNSIAEELDLDYKTVKHHLDLMTDNNVIEIIGEGYGKNYMLTEQMEANMDKLDQIKEQAGLKL